MRCLLLAVVLFSVAACTQSKTQKLPREETITIPGKGVAFRMVHIPTDEKLKPFSIGVNEVTWREINLFRDSYEHRDSEDVGVTAMINDPESGGVFLSDRPVVALTWYTAVAYCEWLSRETGCYFRLPTDPEWEFALRGSSELSLSLDEVAWHRGNSGAQVHSGGQKKANGFGLHDMLGNAWEYILELGSPPGFEPVLRGGSWDTSPEEGLATRRQSVLPKWFEGDSFFPHSLRWLIGWRSSQGMRLVCVTGSQDCEERERYRALIEIRITEVQQDVVVRRGDRPFSYSHVKGVVKNTGDRSVDELEVQFYPLDVRGKPHLADEDGGSSAAWGRPTWGKVWPILSNSAHDGAHRQPLRPKESMSFEGIAPTPYDDDISPGKFGAQVTNLRFSR